MVACVFGALLLFWHFGFPFLMSAGMSNLSIGAVALVGLTLLLFLGVHVGVAMILAGFVGLWLVKGRIALPFVMLGISGNEFLANYYFSAVPLFVLMGLIIAASDIGHETFIVARWATRRISGGLGIAIVGANTIFAAITGSSIASASVFARIATPGIDTAWLSKAIFGWRCGRKFGSGHVDPAKPVADRMGFWPNSRLANFSSRPLYQGSSLLARCVS